MGLPTAPITLAPEQVAELNRRLSEMRHNVNNHLALFTSAGEILTLKPEAVSRVAPHLVERPMQITHEIRQFSEEFERTLGITKE